MHEAGQDFYPGAQSQPSHVLIWSRAANVHRGNLQCVCGLLHALARQGQRILAHRDAVVQAEAAATAAHSASSSVPSWRKWQQKFGSLQPGCSICWQRMAENTFSWWRNGLLDDWALPDDQSEPELATQPFKWGTLPWADALAVLEDHPERAFLQPDLEQVWTFALSVYLAF